MPSDEKLKKSNDPNGFGRCPVGSDVGIFGRANTMVDTMTAGFIYAAAIGELVEQTLDIETKLDALPPEVKESIPLLQEELQALDTRWVIASAMFKIEA